MMDMNEIAPLLNVHDAKAWPFVEAKKILDRIEKQGKSKDIVIFETGYGPSGLPHIGTFGEVARTTMVRHAFHQLSDIPTKLIAFSDDMDGLRKVPDNIPNKELIAPHLGKRLTQVPDPFGTHDSFGRHNNARLRAFLDQFGFEYTFMSSTDCYFSGMFDEALLNVLAHVDPIMEIMLPTLREERKATYSPFLPICQDTGIVLQIPLISTDVKAGTAVFKREDGTFLETPVTGGRCKLQWKVDWAMRWVALGIDYEMSGKDLIDSVKASNQIARVLGGTPPEGFNYELFLDEKGQKISKSKGNGLSIEEWLRYAPTESLAYYMFLAPKRGKKLYFDVIPKCVDEYVTYLEKYPSQTPAEHLENPVWHIHSGQPPKLQADLSFSILLNLASVCNAHDKSILWGFIGRYAPGLTPESAPFLDRLTDHAVHYYMDFIKPTKAYRAPTDQERALLEDLKASLALLPKDAGTAEIQGEVYRIGRDSHFEEMRDWFKCLYETLLGQQEGPRMGSFIAVFGIDETIKLIDSVLKGELLGR